MTWLFNLLIALGATAVTLGLISFLLHFVFVGWKKDLLRWGKALGIIGVILMVVPAVAKPVVGWLTQGPSAEQLVEEAEKTRILQEKAAADQAAVEAAQREAAAKKAAEDAAADAARATAPAPTPAPVTPAASPRVWVVPSGSAGYYVTDGGIVDGSRTLLPGTHPVRPNGKVRLVDTKPDVALFVDNSGDLATIEATTADDKVTTVALGITWMVVPENVALFKSKLGEGSRYTPMFNDIVRGAVRTVIARKRWVAADQPNSILNRAEFAREIQQELDRHTAAHFTRLGFGDQGGNVIRYGEVSLRTITH